MSWNVIKENHDAISSMVLNIFLAVGWFQQWWRYRIPLKLMATISANYSRAVPPGFPRTALPKNPSYELTVTITNNGRDRVTIVSCHALVGKELWRISHSSNKPLTLEPNTAPENFEVGMLPKTFGSITQIYVVDGRGKKHFVPQKWFNWVRSQGAKLANEMKGTEGVFVSQDGSQYHREDCKLLHGVIGTLSLEKALSEGLTACPDCKSPQ